jgi:hypothetical protein
MREGECNRRLDGVSPHLNAAVKPARAEECPWIPAFAGMTFNVPAGAGMNIDE